MNDTEISKEKLEQLKWVWAYLQSLEQIRAFLGQENFPDDPQIKAELDLLQNSIEGSFLRWYRIFKLTGEVQNKCQHDFLEYRSGEFGQRALLAKVCKHCKLIVEKPYGGPGQICSMCWSRMESDGITSGQGSGIHYYKCTNPNCRHAEGFT